jgi:hypothetical protein
LPSTVTPTFTAQASNPMILMGDYQEGLNPQAIKWSVWTTGSAASITKIAVESFTLTYTVPPAMIYQLAICNGAGKIFKIVPNPALPWSGATTYILNEFVTYGGGTWVSLQGGNLNNAPTIPSVWWAPIQSNSVHPDVNSTGAYVYTINQILTTGPVNTANNVVSTYLMLDFSVTGLGAMNLSVYGNNRAQNQALLGFNLSAYNNAINGNATGISNANPGSINFPAHGLFTNQWVTLSGGAGNWVAVNGSFLITVVDTAHFTVPVDTTLLGAYGAQVINVFHPSLSPNLQRMLNFSSESMFVRTQCDQNIPGGVQGKVSLNQIDVFYKDMWMMRPALAIRA